MWYNGLLASLLCAILVGPASAQFPGSRTGNLKVCVVFADSGRPAPSHLSVQLLAGSSNTPVGTAYTSDTGWVEFGRLQVGGYRLVVTGNGIQRAESEQFEVDNRKVTQSQYVYVHEEQSGATNTVEPSGAMVGAADLKVPPSASKELKKGNDALAREDWKKAQEHLSRAVEIYPKYAAALTNLGVAYSHLNDAAGERTALESAIAANDHFAPAYFNLAVLCIRQNSYAEAEDLLQKAVPLDPTNAKTLTFLANMQLLNHQYDAALASAQRVHALSHQNLAVAHFIAARAYERENRPNDAVAELKTFLKEEPEGPRADRVREELKSVQKYVK